jgi:hypothetical protein
VPILGVYGGQRPLKPIPSQAFLYVKIGGHVVGIIVVDKLKIPFWQENGRDCDDQGDAYQQWSPATVFHENILHRIEPPNQFNLGSFANPSSEEANLLILTNERNKMSALVLSLEWANNH